MDNKKNWLHKYFSDDDLIEIKHSVTEAEMKTSGEIVVYFQQKRNWLEKLYDHDELTLKHFYRLGVYRTKDKTGVLVYILFEERYFNILTDEGIHKKIPFEIWDRVENNLKEEFAKENYLAGVKSVVTEIGKILAKEFPRANDDVDEISNEVRVD